MMTVDIFRRGPSREPKPSPASSVFYYYMRMGARRVAAAGVADDVEIASRPVVTSMTVPEPCHCITV